MPASTYLGNLILDGFLRGQTVTPPTTVYVSLHTADPGDTGANEVSLAAWPAYLRVDPAAGAGIATGFDVAAAKATENAKDTQFSVNDGAGAVIVTHFGIWDASTSGNLLFHGALTASKTIAVSDQVIFRPNQLDVSVT